MNQDKIVKQKLPQAFSESNQSVEGNNNSTAQGNESIILQGNDNNVDNSQESINVTVNVIKNKSTTSDNSQENEEYEIGFVISGRAKRKDKTTLKAIEKHLNSILSTTSLTIYDIDEGSIKLFLNGTQEDLEKLENAFKSGELKDIFDIPIEDVNFVEDSKHKLALTITGDISYTDIAKLKSALTGVEEKEILVQKIRNEGKILNLANANLSDANLSGIYLIAAKLQNANLQNANLSRANLQNANLSRANLQNANLQNANLSRANLSNANLSDANLNGTYLGNTTINKKTILDDKWCLVQEIVTQGAVGRDLSRVDLSDANLSRADLSDANLSRANLSRAYLSRADLSRADLSEADLSEVYLRGADLKDSLVLNTKFTSNSSGMTIELKQKLIEKGAIFEDSLEDSLTLSPLKK